MNIFLLVVFWQRQWFFSICEFSTLNIVFFSLLFFKYFCSSCDLKGWRELLDYKGSIFPNTNKRDFEVGLPCFTYWLQYMCSYFYLWDNVLCIWSLTNCLVLPIPVQIVVNHEMRNPVTKLSFNHQPSRVFCIADIQGLSSTTKTSWLHNCHP